ncbi:MAG: hypothetical protein Q9165_001949 [Trypethelium subeluteriae]
MSSDFSDGQRNDDHPKASAVADRGVIIENSDIYQTSESRRQIGLTSAIFLYVYHLAALCSFERTRTYIFFVGSIFNRMIGTGIFATPSAIFTLSGSVGLSLFIWAAGWAGSNSVVFGEYILNAAQVEVNRWNQRGVGLACITAAFLIHGLALKWGLRLQNILGFIKLIILLLIIFAGLAALGGHLKVEKPHNFDNAFEGTTGSAYGVVTALYNVIWSYIGYSNANYAMSEIKNPVRTLRIAAPIAISIVGVLYMLANIAYFAAVPREEIISSGRILAGSFFRNVFGPKAERALSVFVALSAFGNVLSVIFSQGRLVQELGREGVLPFSKLWASNKPLDAPFMGLFEHWLVSVIIMLAPPPGDAYNFIYLYFNRSKYDWHPPTSASLPVALFFLLSNIYLAVAPYVPPDSPDQNIYKSLPYWLHCVVGLGIIAAGGVYWIVWAIVLPRAGKYKLEKEVTVGEDGWTRNTFVKIPR